MDIFFSVVGKRIVRPITRKKNTLWNWNIFTLYGARNKITKKKENYSIHFSKVILDVFEQSRNKVRF